MRALIISTLIALSFIDGENVTVELETEDSSALLKIPISLVKAPRVLSEVKGRKMDVLKALLSLGGEARASEIAKFLNRDESTVRKHLAKLEKLGIIEVEKEKPLSVRARPIARIFLDT